MKKFIFIRSKYFHTIDSFLNKKFDKGYQAGVLTLPAIPYLIHFVNLFVVDYVEFFYPGRGISKLVFDYANKGEKSRWMVDYVEYIKLGKKAFSKNFIYKVKRDFKKASRNFYQFIAKLEKEGVNVNKLYEDYFKFVELYITEYAINYVVTGPLTLGYGDILTSKLSAKYNNSEYIKNAIKILAKPKRDFLREEKESLNKIAGPVRKFKVKPKTLRELRKGSAAIYGKLKDHQKKYYWIANNYKDVRYLDQNYFFNKFQKLLKQPVVFKKKDNSSRELSSIYKNIAKKDVNVLKLLGEVAELHDQRKKANLIANYWLLEFLKKISKKTGVVYPTLKLASLWEVIDLLDNKKVNLKEILKRRDGCMVISLRGGGEYWLSGRNYKLFKNRIDTIIRGEINKNFIKGFAASQGKAEGIAKIVLNVKKDGDKVKTGDILITSMTRPEFMPLISKIKAIVTDEGGITSHAAIISRELNKPCIVGTKVATRVLRDGDLVEVDADRGVVKVISKFAKGGSAFGRKVKK